MKTNKILIVVASVATLAIAGCEKPNEPATEPATTNVVPTAAKPDTSLPSAAESGANAGDTVPVAPMNTNNPAVTNQ